MRKAMYKTKEVRKGKRACRAFAAGLILACVIGAMSGPAVYADAAKQVTLPVSQTFTDDGLSTPGKTFAYQLTATGSAPMPAGSNSGVYSFTVTGNATAQVGPINYSSLDTYTYNLKCVTAAGAGYTIDQQVYTIKVYVTNDGPISVVFMSDGEKTGDIVFNHSYKTPYTPPPKPPRPPNPPNPPQPPNPPNPPTPPTPPDTQITNPPTPTSPPTQPLVQPPADIAPQPPALAAPLPSGHEWSLLSCMMSILAILTALAHLLFIYPRFRIYERYQDDLEEKGLLTGECQDELDELRKKGRLARILAVIAGIITPIVWLILDLPLIGMVWIDHSTPWTALVFIIMLIFTLVFNMRKRDPEDEETERTEDKEFEPNPTFAK